MNNLPLPLPLEEQDEITLLAMLLWGEARGEPREGRIAIAWVVRNRVMLSQVKPVWWGVGWKGVMLKRHQFSCFSPGDINSLKVLEPLKYDSKATWEDCYGIAREIYVTPPQLPDLSLGATHYLVTAIRDRVVWDDDQTMQLTVVIGRHSFFRKRSGRK